MGWNSWDCYGTTVTEAEVLANAEFMAAHLLAAGWDTIVVDICWYDPDAHRHGYTDGTSIRLDDWGRQLPATNRFPSAAGGAGFGPLAAKVHALGLRFGLHIMRGIPRRAVELDLPVLGTTWSARDVADVSSACPWNEDNYGLNHDHPGAQAYYDAQLAQFASWGVDFVKADDMLTPYHDREIAAYATAVSRCGRPMVLSLSPGDDLSVEHLSHLRASAQMWRVSGDLWDRWPDVLAQFARMAVWAPLQQPGAWADADMLPLGRIGIRAELGEDRESRLTPAEQQTLLTLWVMSRSPLMMGGDLPTSSPATIELLTRSAVLDVLTESSGNRELARTALYGEGDSDGEGDGELIVWGADRLKDHTRYVAVFWTGTRARTLTVPLATLESDSRRTSLASGTDLWTRDEVALAGDTLTVDVAAHGVRLVRLSPAP